MEGGSCARCGSLASNVCAHCLSVLYCSKVCQCVHWLKHESLCRAVVRLREGPLVDAAATEEGEKEEKEEEEEEEKRTDDTDITDDLVIDFFLPESARDYYAIIVASLRERGSATGDLAQLYDRIQAPEVAENVFVLKNEQRASDNNHVLRSLTEAGRWYDALSYIALLGDAWSRCTEPGVLYGPVASFPLTPILSRSPIEEGHPGVSAGALAADTAASERWHHVACAPGASVVCVASDGGVHFAWRRRDLAGFTGDRSRASWRALGVDVERVTADKLALFAVVGDELRIAIIRPVSVAGALRERLVMIGVELPTEAEIAPLSRWGVTVPIDLQAESVVRRQAYVATSATRVVALLACASLPEGLPRPEPLSVRARERTPPMPIADRPAYCAAFVHLGSVPPQRGAKQAPKTVLLPVELVDARAADIADIEVRIDDPEEWGATFCLRTEASAGDASEWRWFRLIYTDGDTALLQDWRWVPITRHASGPGYAYDPLALASASPDGQGHENLRIAERKQCRVDLSAHKTVFFSSPSADACWTAPLIVDEEQGKLDDEQMKVRPGTYTTLGTRTFDDRSRLTDVGWCIAPEYARAEADSSTLMALRGLPDVDEIATAEIGVDGTVTLATTDAHDTRRTVTYALDKTRSDVQRQVIAFDGEALVACDTEDGTLREWRVVMSDLPILHDS